MTIDTLPSFYSRITCLSRVTARSIKLVRKDEAKILLNRFLRKRSREPPFFLVRLRADSRFDLVKKVGRMPVRLRAWTRSTTFEQKSLSFRKTPHCETEKPPSPPRCTTASRYLRCTVDRLLFVWLVVTSCYP